MAIAQNPELTIDIKYNSQGAAQEFDKFTRTIEAKAQEHEQKLQNILQKGITARKNLSSQFYVSEEGELKVHQDRLSKIATQQYTNSLNLQKNYQGKLLAGNKSYYSSLESLSKNQRGFLQQEMQMQQRLQPELRQYTSQINGINNAMQTQVKSGSLGGFLAGGFLGRSSNQQLIPIQQLAPTPSPSRMAMDTYGYEPENYVSSASSSGIIRMSETQQEYNNEVKKSNSLVKEESENISKASGATNVLAVYAKAAAVAYSAWKIGNFILDISVASAKAEQLRKHFIR